MEVNFNLLNIYNFLINNPDFWVFSISNFISNNSFFWFANKISLKCGKIVDYNETLYFG